VLTISSLNGEVLESYSNEVFNNLGNWVKPEIKIMVCCYSAVDDHKLRIEVGYGLEDKLTDALSNRIIRREIVPLFKENFMKKACRKA
jgi:uncharacterized protein